VGDKLSAALRVKLSEVMGVKLSEVIEAMFSKGMKWELS
jgi:hypothetical protein